MVVAMCRASVASRSGSSPRASRVNEVSGGKPKPSSRRLSIHYRDLCRFRPRGVTASRFLTPYHPADLPRYLGGQAEECIASSEMQVTDA